MDNPVILKDKVKHIHVRTRPQTSKRPSAQELNCPLHCVWIYCPLWHKCHHHKGGTGHLSEWLQVSNTNLFPPQRLMSRPRRSEKALIWQFKIGAWEMPQVQETLWTSGNRNEEDYSVGFRVHVIYDESITSWKGNTQLFFSELQLFVFTGNTEILCILNHVWVNIIRLNI